ncbi:hypothetical protein AB1K83_06775 [Sporosarcina sp. 179-K 3D1 HS]|uniref:hypothetical protein n=1 Tax=Sporosarcina sp. 179-K 3D1 HS TaxID=3232169 RepID=UPI00399F350A
MKELMNLKDYEMTDEPRGTVDIRKVPKLDKETNSIMRTEILTGLTLSGIYFAFIFLVPILNWYNKDWAFSNMWGGMSYSWFLTAIVSMFMAFFIAWIHTALYERRIKKYSRMISSHVTKEDQAA